MTNQEIFDTVKTHLLTQDAKAIDFRGECVYRAADGKRCAAGCVIPDELYSSDYEGLGADHRELLRVWECLGIDKEGQILLSDLQDVHDDLEPAAWPDALHNVARLHSVKYGVDAQVFVIGKGGRTISTENQKLRELGMHSDV